MRQFQLTKETDPRCIEYWIKAFEGTSLEILEMYRLNWINKYTVGVDPYRTKDNQHSLGEA